MSQSRNEVFSRGHESPENTATNATEVYERSYIDPDDDHPPWASGIKPLRGPTEQELTRDDHIPTTEIVEWLARNERLSYEEQTTGPGKAAIPDPDEIDGDIDRPRNMWQRVRMLSTEMLHMPHPKYTWTTYLLHHSFKTPTAKLEQANLLLKSGEVQIYVDRPATTVAMWRVDPVAYEMALEDYENTSRFPCGHGGVRNLGDGEYSCSEDACPAIYPRATAEDVLWGDDDE